MAGPSLRLNINTMGVKASQQEMVAAFNKISQGAKKTAKDVDGVQSATEKLGKRAGGIRSPMKAMSDAVDRAGGRSKNLGFVINNMSNQVGDFAVQVGMGTSAIKSLAMQAPQAAGALAMLGGPFTAIASVLGLVAAIGLPLVGIFMNMGSAAGGLSDTLDKLGDSTDRLADLNNRLEESKDDLIGKMRRGEVAATKLNIAMAKVAFGRAKDDVIELTKQVADLAKQFSRTDGYQRLSDEILALREQFNLSTDEMFALQERFEDLGRIRSFDDMVKTGTGLITMLDNMGIKLEDVQDDALRKFVDGLGEMEYQAGLTAEEQKRLNELLEEFEKLKIKVTETPPPDLNDVFDPRTTSATDLLRMRAGASKEMQDAIDEFLQSGSSISDAKKTEGAKKLDNQLKQEQARLKAITNRYKPALTAAQEYADVTAKIARAVELKAISEEEGAIATAEATRRYQIASGELTDYTSVANTFARGLEDSMMALVDGTGSVQDAFRSMATMVIKELLRVLVVQRMVNAAMGVFGFAPAAGGGYIPIGGAGNYGGPVQPNKGIVVGESGPEVFYPQTQGTIVPNNATGGNITVNQTINVSTGVQQTVRTEIKSLMPQIAESAKAAVADAKRRGGSYGKAFA